MGIVMWFLVGLIGALLVLVLAPETDPSGWLGTLFLALIGSLVGGFLGNVVGNGDFDGALPGLLGSVIGAAVTLLIYRSVKNRSTSLPTHRPA